MVSTAVSPASVGVAVGDFFVCSWGYDQTNVDFFKVVALTPKGVKVQSWTSARLDSEHASSDSVVPGEVPATVTDWSACTSEMDFWQRKEAKVVRPAPIETKRLRGDASYVGFTVNSFSSASKWDGTPRYQTGAGFGH